MLDDVEQEALERIRKRHRDWRWMRWLRLGVCLFLFGVAVQGQLSQRRVWQDLEHDPSQSIVLVLVYTMARGEVIYRFGLFAGVLVLAHTLGNWRGRPTDILVLRLARDLEDLRDRRAVD